METEKDTGDTKQVYDPRSVDDLLAVTTEMVFAADFYSTIHQIERGFTEIPILGRRCQSAKQAYLLRLDALKCGDYSPQRLLIAYKLRGNELANATPDTLYEVVGNCITKLGSTIDTLIPLTKATMESTREGKKAIASYAAKAGDLLPLVIEYRHQANKELIEMRNTRGLAATTRNLNDQRMQKQDIIRETSFHERRLGEYVRNREKQLERMQRWEDVQLKMYEVMTSTRDKLGLELEWLEQIRMSYSIADHIIRHGGEYQDTLRAINDIGTMMDSMPDEADKALSSLRDLLR